jgi:Trk-type K+ transport system membrane component
MPAILITGIIVIIIGIVGFYIIYKPNKKRAEGLRFSLYGFLLFFSSIFILLGCLAILGYCFTIDGSFITPELNDDMTVLNGIALGVSSLAISGWIELFLKRIKKNHRTV